MNNNTIDRELFQEFQEFLSDESSTLEENTLPISQVLKALIFTIDVED